MIDGYLRHFDVMDVWFVQGVWRQLRINIQIMEARLLALCLVSF